MESLSSFIGADGTNTTIEQRPDVDQPEAARGARPQRLRRDPPAADRSLQEVEGIQLYMQPVQNITVDDRVSRTQYQYTLEDPDPGRTQRVDRPVRREAEAVARAGGRRHRPADRAGSPSSLVIDRVTASRLGIAPTTIDNTLYDAFGQRQINTMYTQLNQYHVILEAEPQFQLDPDMLQPTLHSVQRRPPEPAARAATSSFAGRGSTVGRLECADHSRALYTLFGEYARSARQRA